MNKTGKIYKMYNQYGVYYGSTTQTLKTRLSKHKSEAKTRNCSSHILFENGCIPKIKLLEEVEFNDIKQLREREAYYIKNLECINIEIPFISEEEKENKKKDNKDKKKEYDKEYYLKNKQKISQYHKEYYQRKKQKAKQAKEVFDFLTEIENSNI